MAETFNKVKDNVELLLCYFSHLEKIIELVYIFINKNMIRNN